MDHEAIYCVMSYHSVGNNNVRSINRHTCDVDNDHAAYLPYSINQSCSVGGLLYVKWVMTM